MKKVLIIKAKKPGYRRCNMAFSDTAPTEIPLEKLTEEQIAILTSDPGLVVVEAGAGAAAAAQDMEPLRKENAELQAKLTAATQRVAELEAALAAAKEAAAGKGGKK